MSIATRIAQSLFRENLSDSELSAIEKMVRQKRTMVNELTPMRPARELLESYKIDKTGVDEIVHALTRLHTCLFDVNGNVSREFSDIFRLCDSDKDDIAAAFIRYIMNDHS